MGVEFELGGSDKLIGGGGAADCRFGRGLGRGKNGFHGDFLGVGDEW